ncbi:hypothetical protein QL285_085462 [Trifolium repens]|nr:hypothetical protein QL285_085462 [Trifolium repens]
MGYWVQENWVWNVVWTDVLTEAEAGSQPRNYRYFWISDGRTGERMIDDDGWHLAHTPGFFTVKTSYVSLLNSLVLQALDAETVQALKLLWLNK